MFFPLKGGIYADVTEYVKTHKIASLKKPSFVTVPLAYSAQSSIPRTPPRGSYLLKAQRIGRFEDRDITYSARASCSGEVLGTEMIELPNGIKVPALRIAVTEPASDEGTRSGMKAAKEPYALSCESLCETIILAGIRGSSPDMSLAEELRLSFDKHARLTVNCIDRDPFSEAESEICIEHWEKLIAGIRILSFALKLSECTILIDAKHKKLSDIIKPRIGESEKIRLKFAYNKYPMNSQRAVRLLYGAALPFGISTAYKAYPVIYASELAAIADAVLFGKPYTESVVTVSGNAVKAPGNYIVPAGTPIDLLLELCGGASMPVNKIVAGGALSGKALWSDSSPVYPGIDSVMFLSGKEAYSYNAESQCVHCGRCAEVCPAGLVPAAIAKNVKAGLYARNLSLRVKDCIGCACCAYVCPGEEPLLQYINTAKGRLKRHV